MATILIIEDNQPLANMYKRQLDGDGHQVLLAADGPEGLVQATKKLPQLILLDIVLPQKSGVEVLIELKSHPLTRTIPVLAISAFGGEENRKQILAAGAVNFFEKEKISPRELALQINRLL